MKLLTGIFVAIIVASGGMYVYESLQTTPAPVAAQPVAAKRAAMPTYAWTLAPQAADSTGMPHTHVVITIDGTAHDLGTYEGSCTQIKNSQWQLVEHEDDGVICWWAGGGTELGVFREADKITVRKGQLDEGTAETGGVRGGFQEILAI